MTWYCFKNELHFTKSQYVGQYAGQYAFKIGKLTHLGYYLATPFLRENLPSKEQWVFQHISFIISTINITNCFKLENSLPDLDLHLTSFGKLILLVLFLLVINRRVHSISKPLYITLPKYEVVEFHHFCSFTSQI